MTTFIGDKICWIRLDPEIGESLEFGQVISKKFHWRVPDTGFMMYKFGILIDSEFRKYHEDKFTEEYGPCMKILENDDLVGSDITWNLVECGEYSQYDLGEKIVSGRVLNKIEVNDEICYMVDIVKKDRINDQYIIVEQKLLKND